MEKKQATRENILNAMSHLIEQHPRWEVIDYLTALDGLLERDGFAPWPPTDLKAVVREALKAQKATATNKEEPESAVEIPPAIRPADDWLPDPQNPGYAVGLCGEMMSLGRKGSKPGKVLIPVRQWRKGRTGNMYLMYGYRIVSGKRRKFVPMFQVGMNRFEAERLRRLSYRN